MYKVELQVADTPDEWSHNTVCYHIRYKNHKFGLWHTLKQVIEDARGDGSTRVPIDFTYEEAAPIVFEMRSAIDELNGRTIREICDRKTGRS